MLIFPVIVELFSRVISPMVAVLVSVPFALPSTLRFPLIVPWLSNNSSKLPLLVILRFVIVDLPLKVSPLRIDEPLSKVKSLMVELLVRVTPLAMVEFTPLPAAIEISPLILELSIEIPLAT